MNHFNAKKLKIGFVTTDLMGPIRNGGVGTAFFSLARLLAQTHDVTIILAPEEAIQKNIFLSWQTYYREFNVKLQLLDRDLDSIAVPKQTARAYAVYQELLGSEFDLVHFPDFHGLCYYALLAKKQRLAFLDTVFAVHLHGTLKWDREAAGKSISSKAEAERAFLEEHSIRLADFAISPSVYMAKWVAAQGWRLRQEIDVLQHAELGEFGAHLKPHDSTITKQIFFVGRLETRKGIVEFLDALAHVPANVSVTILGRPGEIYGREAFDYISSAVKNLRQRVKFESNCNHLETVELLKRHRPLVVAPSYCENSPFAVYECLLLGLPCVWTNLGGTAELVHPEDHHHGLTEVSGLTLADRISAWINGASEFPVTRPAPGLMVANEKWEQWHAEYHARVPIQRPPILEKLDLTVCIATKNRPEYLQQALESLANQTDLDFSLLIFDDGSDEQLSGRNQSVCADFSGRLNLKLITSKFSMGPCLARNRLAEVTQSEFLLFMDDDNLALPSEIENFRRVQALSGADIVTCALEYFRSFAVDEHVIPAGAQYWVPLGPCMTLAPFSNIFGDTNMVIRRKVFASVGGFSSTVKIGEDWDLIWRAIEGGARLTVCPQPLVRYRVHASNRSQEEVDPALLGILPRPAINFLQRAGGSHRELLGMACASIARSLPGSRTLEISYERQNDRSEIKLDLLKQPGCQPVALNDCLVNSYSRGFEVEAYAGDSQMELRFEATRLERPVLEWAMYSDTRSELQIYYQTAVNQGYSEERAIYQIVPTGWSTSSVALPIDGEVNSVRLDFGATAGRYFFSGLRMIERARSARELFCYHVTKLSSADTVSGYKWVDPSVMREEGVDLKNILDGHLELLVEGTDPQLFLPNISDHKHCRISWVMEIEVPVATTIELFFDPSNQNRFSQENSISIQAIAGKNLFKVEVVSPEPVISWRIDPGISPGRYVVHRIGYR